MKTGEQRESLWRGPVLPALMIAVLVFGMGVHCHGVHGAYWFYFAPWWLKTGIKFLVGTLLLAAGFYISGDRIRRWLPWMFGGLFVMAQILLTVAAWRTMNGGVPWGFDHPSFMFRLHEFGEVFPRALGGYNPAWNGGTEHFVGVTSGSHGFGVLIWPLLQLGEPHRFYGAALIFWFILGFPWIGALSVRSAGTGWTGSFIAGLLMIGVSRDVFLWQWHFGTVGAMTSAMMALPVTTLGYRLLVLKRGGWGTVLALAVSAWLMCLWTPGVFVGAGLALGWLWNIREWTWKSNRQLLIAGGVALVLLAPWFWITLFPCRSVVEYVGTEMPRAGWNEMLGNGAVRLIRSLEGWHPVILCMGLLGTWSAVSRPVRRWVLPVLLLLGAIAGWSRELKPLSQLERMAIPMAVAAVFPAAILCGRLLDEGERVSRSRTVWRALGRGLLVAALLFGVRTARIFYTNAGSARLRLLPPEMEKLSDWIQAEVPEDARVGFAGKAVHSYGGGNLAYLPVLTGREMMADDYYGFPRGTVEYDYPPQAYRGSLQDWLFFSRAYGVSHWIAATPFAQASLEACPDAFEKVCSMEMLGQTIEVFRVRDPGLPGRFQEGGGKVTARVNHLRVEPADPSADRVVIRYNWRDGLVCRTPGASIEPVAIDDNLTFIGVRPNGNKQVEIGYRAHASPIRPNFDGHFHH